MSPARRPELTSPFLCRPDRQHHLMVCCPRILSPISTASGRPSRPLHPCEQWIVVSYAYGHHTSTANYQPSSHAWGQLLGRKVVCVLARAPSWLQLPSSHPIPSNATMKPTRQSVQSIHPVGSHPGPTTSLPHHGWMICTGCLLTYIYQWMPALKRIHAYIDLYVGHRCQWEAVASSPARRRFESSLIIPSVAISTFQHAVAFRCSGPEIEAGSSNPLAQPAPSRSLGVRASELAPQLTAPAQVAASPSA